VSDFGLSTVGDVEQYDGAANIVFSLRLKSVGRRSSSPLAGSVQSLCTHSSTESLLPKGFVRVSSYKDGRIKALLPELKN